MSSLAEVHRRKHKSSEDKSSTPCTPFPPASHSPQEASLQEGEDTPSRTEESQGNGADNSKGNEDSSERKQLDGASGGDAWKEELFQHFYQVVQRAWDREGPSDCIIISLDKQRNYVTAIGHRLRDCGLVVEIIHLAYVSGVTRALQEVKDDGSPFCIVVERCDVRHSTCTVILLRETFKIHPHMHLEDALVLVAKKFKSFFAERSAGISQRAADLVDDFLARKCLASDSLPFRTQHLLFLLSEGKHLSGDELSVVIDYLKTRKELLEDCEVPGSSTDSPPASLQGKSSLLVGKPPPLLPTPTSFPGAPPPGPAPSHLLGDGQGNGLLPLPGLFDPISLFPLPLLQASTSKKTTYLGRPAKRKRPLLGEKPSLLGPPPVGSSSAVGLFPNFTTMDPVQKAVINYTFGVSVPPKKKQVISCNICQRRFNTDSQAEAHYKGRKHAKKVKALEAMKKKPKMVSSKDSKKANPSCSVTPITGNSSDKSEDKGTLKASSSSPPAGSEGGAFLLDSGTTPLPPGAATSPCKSTDGASGAVAESEDEKAKKLLYCSLCRVAVNSLSQLEAHDTDSEHKTTVEAHNGAGPVKSCPRPGSRLKVQNGSKGSGRENKTWHCEICDVHANSESQLKHHISSRRHKNRVARKPLKLKYNPYYKLQRSPSILAAKLAFQKDVVKPLAAAAAVSAVSSASLFQAQAIPPALLRPVTAPSVPHPSPPCLSPTKVCKPRDNPGQ